MKDELDLDFEIFMQDWEKSKLTFQQRTNNPYYYYLFTLEQIKKYECKSFVDVGCADGVLMKLGADKGLKISGIEISPMARGICKDNIGIEPLDSLDKITASEFDAIALLEIIEHLDNPKEMLKKAYEKAGKLIIFTVPIGENFKNSGHKIFFKYYDIYNICNSITNNFKIFMINKFSKTGNPLNLFGAVIYK